jgi:hypothetical protein
VEEKGKCVLFGLSGESLPLLSAGGFSAKQKGTRTQNPTGLKKRKTENGEVARGNLGCCVRSGPSIFLRRAKTEETKKRKGQTLYEVKGVFKQPLSTSSFDVARKTIQIQKRKGGKAEVISLEVILKQHSRFPPT